MKRRLWSLAFAALLLAGGGGALATAQEPGDATGAECPAPLVCVEIDGHVFEIDEADGSMVGFVTSLSTTTTETLDGTSESKSGEAIWFAQRGDSYVVVAEGVPITEAQAQNPTLVGTVLIPRIERDDG